MSDILLNSDGDILIEGNDLQLSTGVEAMQQHLSQRLKTFLNEWFIDKRTGIPYFEHVLRKNFDPVVIDTVFKREIINIIARPFTAGPGGKIRIGRPFNRFHGFISGGLIAVCDHPLFRSA